MEVEKIWNLNETWKRFFSFKCQERRHFELSVNFRINAYLIWVNVKNEKKLLNRLIQKVVSSRVECVTTFGGFGAVNIRLSPIFDHEWNKKWGSTINKSRKSCEAVKNMYFCFKQSILLSAEDTANKRVDVESAATSRQSCLVSSSAAKRVRKTA